MLHLGVSDGGIHGYSSMVFHDLSQTFEPTANWTSFECYIHADHNGESSSFMCLIPSIVPQVFSDGLRNEAADCASAISRKRTFKFCPKTCLGVSHIFNTQPKAI